MFRADLNADAVAAIEDFRKEFMERIYRPKNFRKITQSEACPIQGFPDNFMLTPSRPRWMKLIGNSVAVSVIKILVNAVVGTGVFDVTSDKEIDVNNKPVARVKQISFINVMKEYPEKIVENKPIIPQHEVSNVDLDKNVLISYVKADNMEQYLDQSAKIYYTGKRFPSTVALNKLY